MNNWLQNACPNKNLLGTCWWRKSEMSLSFENFSSVSPLIFLIEDICLYPSSIQFSGFIHTAKVFYKYLHLDFGGKCSLSWSVSVHPPSDWMYLEFQSMNYCSVALMVACHLIKVFMSSLSPQKSTEKIR